MTGKHEREYEFRRGGGEKDTRKVQMNGKNLKKKKGERE